MNIENLKRALKHIDKIDERLFSMKQYRNEGSFKSHKCGTVGCIIGHCVVLTPAEEIDEKYRFKKYHHLGDIMFTKWSYDFFSLKVNCQQSENYWDYLFSSSWATVAEFNTVRHAKYRMQKVIDGYVPLDIDFEMKKELNDLAFYCGA